MADYTPADLRTLVFYEVYVRNHGPQGTFAEVQADLKRIRALGVDVVWLMPVHPIGRINRKGRLGSPYAIRDFMGVNPEYGTREDFSRLLEAAHRIGLRLIMDVVCNHAAYDTHLLREHGDWFQRNAKGHPLPASPDWTDVIAMAYPNDDLSDYFIDVLKSWVRFGVDGFRCDYASAMPLKFWQEARREVAKIRPGIIWLAESLDPSAVAWRRASGLPTLSESEISQAFDIGYDYDLWPIWQAAVRGKVSVKRYLELLRFQECLLPEDFVKLRSVENHDQFRIMELAPSYGQAVAWMAFQAFNNGALLIYAGQESAAKHRPSLFDKDPIQWGSYQLQPLLASLTKLKKHSALVKGRFDIIDFDRAIQAVWKREDGGLYGIFNVNAAGGVVPTALPDGDYEDLLRKVTVRIRRGNITLPKDAVVFGFDGHFDFKRFESSLFDYNFPGQ